MFKVVKAAEGTPRQISPNKSANNLITKELGPAISLATTEAEDYYEQETTPYNRMF